MKFLWAFLCFLLSFGVSFAYSDNTTHPGLTDEIIDLFNLYYPGFEISDEYKELTKNGSTNEDSDIRSMRHFYDPVYNRGVEVAGTEWQSSKDWAVDTVGQARLWDQVFAGSITSYFGSNTDHSWDRAIYEYVWGDKNHAMYDLGHILHLIEDAAVPDHTRNDPHPPLFHLGSPYEAWTAQFGSEQMEGLAKSLYSASRHPIILRDLQNYFESMATYSNNNFFSKDTTPDKNNFYSKPVLGTRSTKRLSNGQFYLFVYSDSVFDFYKLALINIDAVNDKEEYFIKDDDNLTLSDYWDRLSKQAVLHGAGVVKLFFDEVEKEKQSKILFNKNKSWFAKAYDVAKNKIFGISVILYGSSLKNNDLTELNNDLSTPQNAAQAVQKQEIYQAPVVSSVITPPSPLAESDITSEEGQNVKSSVSNISNNLGVELLSNVGGGGPFNTPRIAPENDIVSSPSEGGAVGGDTTAPEISFSISECLSSLSSEGCLVASSNLLISWSSISTDLASYDIECALSGNSCSGFSFSATIATSTNYSLPVNEKTYQFRARSRDTSGNISDWQNITLDYYSMPVVINEIAWAGTSASSADEWIELYNKTGKSISLSSWTMYTQDLVPYLNLSGTISANGYYLIERTDDNTVSDISADLIIPFSGIGSGSGLSNSGEILILSYASTTIDQTVLCSNAWCGGTNSAGNASMERVDPNIAGADSTNWGTSNNVVKRGKDANGVNLTATPKSRNSLNYLISQTNTLSLDKILKKSQSPYIVPTSQDFIVNIGVILTVEPGVIIKMGDQSSITINGDIFSSGTTNDFITFTSIYDDSYEGDTNGDGSTSLPHEGDWKYLRIQSPSQNSQINFTRFKYGGRYFSTTALDLRAMVSIFEATTTISNSIFEESRISGLRATRFNGTISGSSFNTGTTTSPDKIGLYIYEGSPTISGSTFSNNYTGLTIESTTVSLDSLIFSNNYLGVQSLNSTLSVSNPSSIIFTNNAATTSPGGLF